MQFEYLQSCTFDYPSRMNTYFKFLPPDVLDRKVEKGEFPFSKFLFWDSPVENIDTELHKNYIIERVISRGLLKDFFFLLQIYSKDEIINALKKSRVLDKKTVNFCCHYFNIPITDMHASSFYP